MFNCKFIFLPYARLIPKLSGVISLLFKNKFENVQLNEVVGSKWIKAINKSLFVIIIFVALMKNLVLLGLARKAIKYPINYICVRC